jgi:hypothetical protein
MFSREVAREWREKAESTDNWQKLLSVAEPPPGEAGGFLVRSEKGVVAYLKPTRIDPACPRAAHEKICADLAHERIACAASDLVPKTESSEP